LRLKIVFFFTSAFLFHELIAGHIFLWS